MRSDTVKKGYEKAPHRSLLRAVGLKDADFDKPFIGVANSYVEIIPGHVHLQEVGRIVREAIREAGGVPFEFNTIGVDDGIAMGHTGHELLPAQPRADRRLPSRPWSMAHCFDGLVCIPNCDKIVPGHADGGHAREHPDHLRQRRADGGRARPPTAEAVDLISVFEGVGALHGGKIDEAELAGAGEDAAAPTAAPAPACSRPTR